MRRALRMFPQPGFVVPPCFLPQRRREHGDFQRRTLPACVAGAFGQPHGDNSQRMSTAVGAGSFGQRRLADFVLFEVRGADAGA